MRYTLLALLLCLSAELCAAEKVTVAILNCEFLSTRKVHVKFGMKFDTSKWTEEEREIWTDDFRAARYKESVEAIATAIKRIDADVIVLTEVARIPKEDGEFITPNDMTILHDEVKTVYPHMVFGDSSDKFTWQNVAVLSKRPFEGEPNQRIRGREGYYSELDDPESEEETTISKGLSVVVTVDGDPVHIYAIHLKSERGGHESDGQRIAQASIVRRNYLKNLENGHHVVVAGDLNDHRGQPTLRRIRGLDDIGEDLAQTGGPTFFKQKDGEKNEEFNVRMREHWTYEYARRRNQIDHILISQSIRNHCTQRNFHKRMKIDFIDITEKIGDTEDKATDHRAVKLTLEFLDTHL